MSHKNAIKRKKVSFLEQNFEKVYFLAYLKTEEAYRALENLAGLFSIKEVKEQLTRTRRKLFEKFCLKPFLIDNFDNFFKGDSIRVNSGTLKILFFYV